METLRLILGSKAFATIAGGSLLMILGAALGVAIGSDSSSTAATSLATITRNGTTKIVAVSAKPTTVKHKVKVTVTNEADGHRARRDVGQDRHGPDSDGDVTCAP